MTQQQDALVTIDAEIARLDAQLITLHRQRLALLGAGYLLGRRVRYAARASVGRGNIYRLEGLSVNDGGQVVLRCAKQNPDGTFGPGWLNVCEEWELVPEEG